MKRSKTKILAVVATAAVMLSTIIGPAGAMAAGDRNGNHQQQEERSYNRPLIQSVSPTVGATVVRPDQSAVFQLDPKAPLYKYAAQYLMKGGATAYLLNSAGATPIDKNQIKFDTATGQLAVQHPMLTRHTQYAIVLDSMQGGQEDQRDNGARKSDNNRNEQQDTKFLDVVTAVDTAADSITLLGHGTISFADEGKQEDHHDSQAARYKIGDVVTGKIESDNGKTRTQLEGKKELAVATLFTTGSALNEATHLAAKVQNVKARVTDGAAVDVQVTDDYGLPATNATVTVTSDSQNLSSSPLSLGAKDGGKGTIALTDHKKEIVGLTVTAQDNQYHDAANTQTAKMNEEFLAGPTHDISIAADKDKIRVTQPAHVTGQAKDVYGNPVEDTSTVAPTFSGGSAPGSITPQNGQFAFDVTAGTKKGAAELAVSSDSAVSAPVKLQILADVPDHMTFEAKSPLTVGKTEVVTGVVYDKYGNTVENDTIVVVTPSAGSVDAPQKNTNDGAYSFTFTAPTLVQSVDIAAKDGDAITKATVQLKADEPVNIALTNESPSMTAGDSQNVAILVKDQYGNPVPNATLSVSASGSAKVPGTVATDDKGQAVISVSDTKAESVTIGAMAANGMKGTAQVDVKAGAPYGVTFKADKASMPADGKTVLKIAASVTDKYGNPIPNYTLTLSTASKAVIPATIQTDASGVATFSITDTLSENGSIMATTANGINGFFSFSATISPDTKVTLKATKQPDGSVIITGTALDASGKALSSVIVPLDVTGGTLANATVVADATGNFTVVMNPASASQPAKVSVPTAVNQPEIGIDPLIYGNQPWTDTGIDVVAGQTIHVVSSGDWASKLYAQINGVPVLVGTDGTFTTGLSGRVYLGTNGAAYPGNVDSVIYLSGSDQHPSVLPTLDLVVDKNSLPADGKSTATVSGRLMEGTTPVIGATVSLSQSTANGKLAAQVVTDTQGRFSTTYTAGMVVESVTITGVYSNLTQKTAITLAQPVLQVPKQAPAGMLGYTPPAGTTVTASSSYGVNTPNNIFDGQLGTVWNSGGYSGTITLAFPTPQTISAIQVAMGASPSTAESYTIKGLENGVWKTIGNHTPYVNNPSMVILSPMQITPGSYDALEISIGGSSSWVQINEITLIESFSVASSAWSGNLSKSYMAWSNWSTSDNIAMVAGNGAATVISEVTVAPLSSNSSIRLDWGAQTNSALTLYASTDGVNYVKMADAPNIGTGDVKAATLSLPVSFTGASKVYLKFSEVWNGTVMAYSYSVATNIMIFDGTKIYQVKPTW